MHLGIPEIALIGISITQNTFSLLNLLIIFELSLVYYFFLDPFFPVILGRVNLYDALSCQFLGLLHCPDIPRNYLILVISLCDCPFSEPSFLKLSLIN